VGVITGTYFQIGHDMKPHQDRFRRSTTTGYVGAPGNWTGTPRRFNDRWQPIQQQEESPALPWIIFWSASGAIGWYLFLCFVFSF
jgi:hypothetical protein